MVVDGPALSDAGAIALCPFVDAVVLVPDARRMRRKVLSLARRQPERAEADVLGIVFNRVTPSMIEADVID